MLRRLREAGFPPEVAYDAFHALDSHILGFTLWQVGHSIADESDLAHLAGQFLRVPARRLPVHARARSATPRRFRPRQAPGPFELVLDLILDGLEHMRS